VSTYQKVASFQLVGQQKQGGNVASYFCTPDGRVLHAVAGPVNADTFLREARWAGEAYKLGQLETRDDGDKLRTFLGNAHAERLRLEYGLNLDRNERRNRRALDNPGKIHILLAAASTPRIEQIYRLVFEKILNEKVSTAPVLQIGR
jgi:hypothetical protein